MRWVEEEEVQVVEAPTLRERLEEGDLVTYPIDRQAYGFGVVVEVRRGRAVLDAESYPPRRVEVDSRRVVLQYKREEIDDESEEFGDYDGGGTEGGVDEDKGRACGEREREESAGEGEESIRV